MERTCLAVRQGPPDAPMYPQTIPSLLPPRQRRRRGPDWTRIVARILLRPLRPHRRPADRRHRPRPLGLPEPLGRPGVGAPPPPTGAACPLHDRGEARPARPRPHRRDPRRERRKGARAHERPHQRPAAHLRASRRQARHRPDRNRRADDSPRGEGRRAAEPPDQAPEERRDEQAPPRAVLRLRGHGGGGRRRGSTPRTSSRATSTSTSPPTTPAATARASRSRPASAETTFSRPRLFHPDWQEPRARRPPTTTTPSAPSTRASATSRTPSSCAA